MAPAAVQNPVRVARLEAGLSQVALAVRAKVSLSTIRLAEYGIATTKTRAAIAAALGTSVDEILGRTVGIRGQGLDELATTS